MTGKATLGRLKDRQNELRIIYRELDFQRRAAFFEGTLARLSRPSPVNFLRVAQVENLVVLIQMDQRPAFTLTPRFKQPPEVHTSPAGEALLRLDEICEFAYGPRHRLSPRVRAFLQILRHWRSDNPWLPSFRGEVAAQELASGQAIALNALVARVRQVVDSPEFAKELNREQGVADRRYQDAVAYVQALRRAAGDILVIPLQINAAYHHRRNAEMREDGDSKIRKPALVNWFNSFRAEARHHAAMKDVIGFIGCWEYSEAIGYVARALFILDAARVPDGEAAAQAIGKCWVEYSKEQGSFHPAYLSSADHEKLMTVVPVRRGSNRASRQLLEVALRYLTQQELVFRDFRLDFDRFFRGEIRKAAKSKDNLGHAPVNEPVVETSVEAVAGVDSADDSALDDAINGRSLRQEPIPPAQRKNRQYSWKGRTTDLVVRKQLSYTKRLGSDEPGDV